MISNSIRQVSEELFTQFFDFQLGNQMIAMELPELEDVFLKIRTNSDYPAWEDLMAGLDLPALDALDPVYGSFEL